MAAAYEDPYLTCPLNESHRIRKSRMQCHLTKCLKSHRLMDKIKCPFNPLHIIFPNDMTHHMKVCESKASVTVQRYDRDDRKCFSGIISEQEAMAQLEAAFGSFSNEVEQKHGIDTPGYDPIQANIDNPLFRTLNCESKAKRKEFRVQERKRIAAIEAEQGKKVVETIQDESPKCETLQPLRSQSILAAYRDGDERFQQQGFSTIHNYSSPLGFLCENEDLTLEVFSNGRNDIRSGTTNSEIEENPFHSVSNFYQPPIEDDTDDIARKLELLSQQENEILEKRRELMMKLTRQASEARNESKSFLESVSSKFANKNPFSGTNNDSTTNESAHSSPEKASSSLAAKKSPTPTFELSSHFQSSAWNVVARNKSNTSTTSKSASTFKPAEAPVAHPVVKPIAQSAVKPVAQSVPPTVAQVLPSEQKPPVTLSSSWTTVSRSKKISTVSESPNQKIKTKPKLSSPVRETSWREPSWGKTPASNDSTSTFESQSTSLDVKAKSRESSPVGETAPQRKVEVPKETPSKSTRWNENQSNLQETSPACEDVTWNKVATLKENSASSESAPWSVMVTSKKISSSQQCTQWKLAPETIETVEMTATSPLEMVESLKISESHQSASEKMTNLNETSPKSTTAFFDPRPKSRPVLKDSSQKCTLVSTTASSSTVSSSYSTMAKINKDKSLEPSVTSFQSSDPSQEFLAMSIPRRPRTSTLLPSQNSRPVAPVAGRGIIHALDEIKAQKKNDTSRQFRPGSANSFSSSFDRNDIEGVYGYEESP